MRGRVSAAQSLEEVMAVVSHGVRALLQADGATFVLRDGDQCYYADEDAVSPLWKGRRFPMSDCISGWCMTHGQSVAIPDIYQDGRIPADAYRPTFVRSLAMTPVGREKPLAALGAYWSEQRQIQPDEMTRLAAIAEAAALALARLRRQAPRDAPAPSGAERRGATPRNRATTHASGLGLSGIFAPRLRPDGLRPNSPESYAFAAICVLVATLVREAFKASGAHGLAIFAAYYPAVLLAVLAGGRRSGFIAAGLGALAAYYFFMPPLFQVAAATASDVLNLTLFGGSCALIILSIDWYQRAVLRLREEDARHLTLAREQNHRLKNAVTIVDAVLRQTLRDQPERGRTIARRIQAGLAQIDLLDEDLGHAASLRDLLTAELEPFDLARFTLDGDDLPPLSGKTQSVLSLIVHELATNALKYGALSAPEGQVSVAWRWSEGRAQILWSESGGPPVQPPQRRGYGSVLLQRMVQSVGGALAIGFPPSGVTADISLAVQ